jgi:DNA primase
VIDRALPLLKPGKSFRFAIVEGGKDPDDVLREQGAAALKAQLSQTTPFVEALFVRERDLEVLDTPERRAGLKRRLRAAAGAIADKDLQQAYWDELLQRFASLFAAPRSERAGEFGRSRGRGAFRQSGREGFAPPFTPEGKAAAKRLARTLEPRAAALALAAVRDPGALDDHLEDGFTATGFGEPALAQMLREIIRLRLEADHLDSDSLQRHLASCGFSALLTDIERAAATSGAPILKEDVSLDARRSQWSRGFAALSRAAALDDAIAAAKGSLGGREDMAAIERLKAERDGLKRAIRTGTIWTGDGS